MMQKSAEYLWEAAHKTGPWEHQGPPWSREQSGGEGRIYILLLSGIWCRKSVRGLVQIAKDKPTSSGFTLTQVKWFAVTRLECHTPPFLCHNYPFKERSQKKKGFCGENSLTADSTSWQACWVLLPEATDYTITLGHWLGLRTLSVRTLLEETISWNPGKIGL